MRHKSKVTVESLVVQSAKKKFFNLKITWELHIHNLVSNDRVISFYTIFLASYSFCSLSMEEAARNDFIEEVKETATFFESFIMS